MQEFSKVYLPILGVALIFSGFWYVKAYFAFFAMNEVVPTLSLDYIAQFSFSLIYELLTFRDFHRSMQFALLVFFLVALAYVLPHWSIRWPNAMQIWGIDRIPITPFWLRLLLATGVSFLWIFFAAHQIGQVHACQFLQGKINLTTTVDAVSSEEDYKALYNAFGHEPPNQVCPNAPEPQLTEVWRTSQFVYIVEREANCDNARTVLKVSANRFPILRLNLELQ